jgi:hypothetical protein
MLQDDPGLLRLPRRLLPGRLRLLRDDEQHPGLLLLLGSNLFNHGTHGPHGKIQKGISSFVFFRVVRVFRG